MAKKPSASLFSVPLCTEMSLQKTALERRLTQEKRCCSAQRHTMPVYPESAMRSSASDNPVLKERAVGIKYLNSLGKVEVLSFLLQSSEYTVHSFFHRGSWLHACSLLCPSLFRCPSAFAMIASFGCSRATILLFWHSEFQVWKANYLVVNSLEMFQRGFPWHYKKKSHPYFLHSYYCTAVV